MEISVFEVIGPVMIGPSSSHTAGAARLARAARLVAGDGFSHVSFGMHGSFSKTAKGHGTDRALLAGALGLCEDDERLADAFSLAKQAGVSWDFYELDLGNAHPNSVRITFSMHDGSKQEIVGSSIGGGRIVITGINGFETELQAQSNTLVISQHDRRGVISDISRVLAQNGINIGVMKLSRRQKGDVAFTIIETDGVVPDAVAEHIRGLEHIISARVIQMDQQEGC